MGNQHEAFCIVDPHFDDTPAAAPTSETRGHARRPAPERWRRRTVHHCVVDRQEDDTCPPTQGWAVHVSGCDNNAERSTATSRHYCAPRGAAFMVLCGPPAALARSAMYTARAGRDPLVTIYPRGEATVPGYLAPGGWEAVGHDRRGDLPGDAVIGRSHC
jgi:hypothetical protein